jgi:hypothetical protein
VDPALANHEDNPQELDSHFTDDSSQRNSAGPSNPVKLLVKDTDNSKDTDSLSDPSLSDLSDSEDEELEAELYDTFGDDHVIDITTTTSYD